MNSDANIAAHLSIGAKC